MYEKVFVMISFYLNMEHTYILKDENTATLTVLFWTELVVADLVAVEI